MGELAKLMFHGGHDIKPLNHAGAGEETNRLLRHDKVTLYEAGAATTDFTRLQFDDVPATERAAIEPVMFRYCELDTLAMVLVYGAWRDWVRNTFR